ncbi:hypothetical protein CTI12_AA566700 [Artemisia annua]|uniref:Helitron helicase-like domain-containing protein n=1 Tax=Artemisia annua TaxID=35608 RepID=A0A2U1KTE9_ARTAN|nr:hypothetical protein CTI12_AA566700 [Artemisia annua]
MEPKNDFDVSLPEETFTTDTRTNNVWHTSETLPFHSSVNGGRPTSHSKHGSRKRPTDEPYALAFPNDKKQKSCLNDKGKSICFDPPITEYNNYSYTPQDIGVSTSSDMQIPIQPHVQEDVKDSRQTRDQSIMNKGIGKKGRIQEHQPLTTMTPTYTTDRKRQRRNKDSVSHEEIHRTKRLHTSNSMNNHPTTLNSEVRNLIQILDEHNELVQVFKTARDKFNEANVPEFKIQLYNVVGAREYHLPSSNTFGAIVFQPDANSKTDYDIIIEYKDRQPKRINKLHSSYMSLQFPLLVVYGQPGYNTKMTFKVWYSL